MLSKRRLFCALIKQTQTMIKKIMYISHYAYLQFMAAIIQKRQKMHLSWMLVSNGLKSRIVRTYHRQSLLIKSLTKQKVTP